MAKSRKTDIRAKASEAALVEAAERVFAVDGLGASLRAIATEAGSANSSAVQYHFGDRAGLIQAIFNQRLGEVEARRGELKSALGDQPDATALLKLIAQPLFEQRDAKGRHSYAAFLLALRRSPEGLAARRARAGQAPLAEWAVAQLRALSAHLDQAQFDVRMSLFSAMLLDALDRYDVRDADGLTETDLLGSIAAMGHAMLEAPAV